MSTSQTTLVGQTLKNRYRVEEPLGAGGMGAVFLGVDEDLSRPIVVKVPHATFLTQPGFLIRFQKEIGNLLALEHKNVVKVLDAGTTEQEVPYLVLQFLRGGNLEDRLAQKVTSEEVLEWLPQIAEALDFIHARGYVHRDIKPANILFDDQGHPYVADFGITKALGDENTMVTAPGYTPGTPNYMAPEAESVNPLTGAYDQYALAVVVYQALSEAIPHQGTTPYEILNAKKTQKPVPLTKAAPHVPQEISRAVMVALEKEPRDRYGSCQAFAMAFEQAHKQTTQKTSAGATSRLFLVAAAVVVLGAGIFAWFALGGGGADADTKTDTGSSAVVDGGADPTQGRENPTIAGLTPTPPASGREADGGGDGEPATPTSDGGEPETVEPVKTGQPPPVEALAVVPWASLKDSLRIGIEVDVDVATSTDATVDRDALARHAKSRWSTALASEGLSIEESEDPDLVIRAQYSLKANEMFGTWMGLGDASIRVLADGVQVTGWDDSVGPGDSRKAPGSSASGAASDVLANLVRSNAEDLVQREAEKRGFLESSVSITLPEGVDAEMVRRTLERAKGVSEATTDGGVVSVEVRRGSLREIARHLESITLGAGREFEVASWDARERRLVLRFVSE